MCIRDSFHTFRREAGSVSLKNAQEDEPDTEELEETLTGMDYILSLIHIWHRERTVGIRQKKGETSVAGSLL